MANGFKVTTSTSIDLARARQQTRKERWKSFQTVMTQNKAAMVGAMIIGVYLLMMLIAPIVAPMIRTRFH